MRKLSGSSIILIVLMVAMPVFIAFALQLHYFASKSMPILFSSVVFVLAGITLIREIRKDRQSRPLLSGDMAADGEASTSARFVEYLPFAAWVVGFSFGIYLLGFTISIALFTGTYMKGHGSRWWMAIIGAVAFATAIHICFDLLLQSDLYEGLVPMYLNLRF